MSLEIRRHIFGRVYLETANKDFANLYVNRLIE